MLRSPRGVTVLHPGKNQGELASLPSRASPQRGRILTSWPRAGPAAGGLGAGAAQPLLSFSPSYTQHCRKRKRELRFREASLQRTRRAQDWPNLLLLRKKRPIETSEKYPLWKNKEQKDVGGAAPQHYKGRKALACLAAQGCCCFIQTPPIKSDEFSELPRWRCREISTLGGSQKHVQPNLE